MIEVSDTPTLWRPLQRMGARTPAESGVTCPSGRTGRSVARVIPLAFLAPDIVASILDGTQPVDLTAQKVIKQIDLPLDWAEQRTLLGFAP